MESSIDERHGHVETHPGKGHKNDPRDRTPLLQGQSEKDGTGQPGEVKETNSVFLVSGGDCKKEGDRLFSRICCDRIRGNCF